MLIASPFVGVLLFSLLQRKTSISSTTLSLTPILREKKHYQVGVITPLSNATQTDLKNGLLTSLRKYHQATYSINVYQGNNDRVTLANQSAKALKENDAIVTFGLSCTNITYEVAHRGNNKTIILFAEIKSYNLP